jgi:hypothetical protein
VSIYTLLVILGLLLALALGGTSGSGRAEGGDRVRAGRGRERSGGSDLVQRLEELFGHLGVLGHDLLLDGSLQGELELDLVGGGVENGSLAAALALHSRSDGGEAVKALTDGLTTLLLGDDVVELLLGIGETRLVDAAGRGDAGSVVAGSHGDRVRWVVVIVGGCYCREVGIVAVSSR